MKIEQWQYCLTSKGRQQAHSYDSSALQKKMVLFIDLLRKGLTQEIDEDGGCIWWAPGERQESRRNTSERSWAGTSYKQEFHSWTENKVHVENEYKGFEAENTVGSPVRASKLNKTMFICLQTRSFEFLNSKFWYWYVEVSRWSAHWLDDGPIWTHLTLFTSFFSKVSVFTRPHCIWRVFKTIRSQKYILFESVYFWKRFRRRIPSFYCGR